MIRNYFKNVRILAVTEAILQLKGLFVLPFITRLFGPVNYGLWAQVSVLVSTAAPLIVLGTDSGFLRLIPGKKLDEKKSAFSANIIFLVGMSLLVAVPFFLASDTIAVLFFGDESVQYQSFLPLAAIWLGVGVLLSSIRNWFRVQNEAKLLSVNILLQAMLSIFAIAITLINKQGPYQLVSYSLIADSLLILIMLTIIFRKWGLSTPDFSILPKMLRFGLPLVPLGFATWGLNFMDRLFLVNYTTLAQVGIYAVAYRIAMQIVPLLGKPLWVMFSNSAAELYELGRKNELQRLVDLTMATTITLTFPASLGLFLLGERVITIFTTKDFLAGIPVLLFVSSAYIFSRLQGYFGTFLGLLYKQALITFVRVIAFLINLSLNFWLIPQYGIIGAAISTSVAFFVDLLITMFLAIRYKVVKVNFVFPLRILTASLIMAAIVKVFDVIAVGNWENAVAESAILIFIGIVSYSIFLTLFGVLTKERMKIIMDVVFR